MMASNTAGSGNISNGIRSAEIPSTIHSADAPTDVIPAGGSTPMLTACCVRSFSIDTKPWLDCGAHTRQVIVSPGAISKLLILTAGFGYHSVQAQCWTLLPFTVTAVP